MYECFVVYVNKYQVTSIFIFQFFKINVDINFDMNAFFVSFYDAFPHPVGQGGGAVGGNLKDLR